MLSPDTDTLRATVGRAGQGSAPSWEPKRSWAGACASSMGLYSSRKAAAKSHSSMSRGAQASRQRRSAVCGSSPAGSPRGHAAVQGADAPVQRLPRQQRLLHTAQTGELLPSETEVITWQSFVGRSLSQHQTQGGGLPISHSDRALRRVAAYRHKHPSDAHGHNISDQVRQQP